jgi:hypothetical protein
MLEKPTYFLRIIQEVRRDNTLFLPDWNKIG